MSSNFENVYKYTANPSQAATFGETVTYTVAGGAPASVTMIVDRKSREWVDSAAAADTYEQVMARLLVSDIATPIDLQAATGDSVDQVAINSEDWYVREVVDTVAGWHILRLTSKLLP
ncbi:MAG: hypothetical protein GY851_03400 [bacterium]|nr:hypothetical protein [bacterium]